MTFPAKAAELTHILCQPGRSLILLSRMLFKSYNHQLASLQAILSLYELKTSANQQLQHEFT